jgi:hypothetical protein
MLIAFACRTSLSILLLMRKWFLVLMELLDVHCTNMKLILCMASKITNMYHNYRNLVEVLCWQLLRTAFCESYKKVEGFGF